MNALALGNDSVILLVDDDESRRYAKSRTLRKAGFEVVETGYGMEALALAREIRPRLALVDVGLPDLDGREVCRQLKAMPETSSMAVLQISGTFVTEADTVAALESGADASLVEPVEPQVLIATARALIRARLAEEAMREALAREQKARASAEDANRIKDEFLAVLSHELRSPLGAILTWTTLLRSGQVDPPRLERALEAIERNARVQARLIEDLLDISRIISGKSVLDIAVVELGPVVEGAVESVRSAAEAKSIRLEVEIDPTVGPVTADATRLQQVLWNLLSNAVKFTARGGITRVEVASAGSQAMIRVRDNGRGISPQFLGHVFERFRQADSSTTRQEGGLGLGLAIVRHIVEQHGGTVTAESPGLGLGSIFTILLPLPAVRVASEPGETRHRIPAATLTRLDGLKALVVDDERDAREAVTAVLEASGARVVAVDGAAAALEALAHEEFGAMISDIGMPGQDGYALIHRIREIENGGRRMPSLVLTAYANRAELRRMLESGFDASLIKPIDARELLREVARLAHPTTRVPVDPSDV